MSGSQCWSGDAEAGGLYRRGPAPWGAGGGSGSPAQRLCFYLDSKGVCALYSACGAGKWMRRTNQEKGMRSKAASALPGQITRRIGGAHGSHTPQMRAPHTHGTHTCAHDTNTPALDLSHIHTHSHIFLNLLEVGCRLHGYSRLIQQNIVLHDLSVILTEGKLIVSNVIKYTVHIHLLLF